MVIATKSNGIVGLGVNDRGLSRRHIINQVETSLRRFQTDYLDLYYAHDIDPDTRPEQTLAVYDDLIRQGKIRYIGLSNHPAWQVTRALWIADDRRLQTPVAAQVKYNLIDRAAERELAPACGQFGLSIIPYAPLHGGLLADLAVLGRDVSGDERFGAPGFSEAEISLAREVERLSREWGLCPYQVSLAWLLSRPAVASVIALQVQPGEVLGIAGVQGSGREELTRVIFGAEQHQAGELDVSGRKVRFASPAAAVRAGIGYIPSVIIKQIAGCNG